MLTVFNLDLNGLLQDNYRKIRSAINAAFDGAGTVIRGGSLRDIKPIAGAYTFVPATDCERILRVASATPVAVTLPATAPAGSQAVVVQYGAGAVSFASSGTGAVRNVASQTKTGGQYARVTVEVIGNSDGRSAEWLLAGATGA